MPFIGVGVSLPYCKIRTNTIVQLGNDEGKDVIVVRGYKHR